MKNELKELPVNMPDCSNRLFYICCNKIIKQKRIALKDAKNAILFYNLSIDLQKAINKFLNPKAL
jgi:hypothetical protein